jgi:hypothetical protein
MYLVLWNTSDTCINRSLEATPIYVGVKSYICGGLEQLLALVPPTTIHILCNGETISCNEPASSYILWSVAVVQSSESCKKP